MPTREMKKALLASVMVYTVLASSISGLTLVSDAKANPEAPPLQWSKTYKSVIWPIGACSMTVATDGGYVLASGIWNFESNLNDFLLVKIDALGNMEWNRTYGGTGNDQPYALVTASDGGYAIAGRWNSLSGYKGQPYNSSLGLIKTDKFGNMEWNRTYEGIGDAPNPRLVVARDGGYALTGFSKWLNSYGNGSFLVKTDALGRLEWNRTIPIGARALVAATDGGYALAGGVYGGSGDAGDFSLVKTDSLGNVEWSQTYPITGLQAAYSVVVTADGGYALSGSSQSEPGSGVSDFLLVKTDEFGSMEWNRAYGVGAGTDFARSMVATADGGYAIVGDTQFSLPGGRHIWVVKTDALGNMEWNQTIGGVDDRGYSIVTASDGGYAVMSGSDLSVSLAKLAPESPALSPSLSPSSSPTQTLPPSPSIPEFPLWIILPIVMVATLLSIVARALGYRPNISCYCGQPSLCVPMGVQQREPCFSSGRRKRHASSSWTAILLDSPTRFESRRILKS